MSKVLVALLVLLTLSACRRGCDCTAYETCFGSTCSCGQWTEGAACTPMREKFFGQFIGSLVVDGGIPVADTIILLDPGYPVQYVFARGLPIRTPVRAHGIRMQTPRTGLFFSEYLQKDLSNAYIDNFNPIDCGTANLSSDNRTLSITYHPLLDSTLIDFSHTYVFSGTRQ